MTQAPSDPARPALDARVLTERAHDDAARRAAVREAHARGPGANIEDAIRMVRAGAAMRGVARR